MKARNLILMIVSIILVLLAISLVIADFSEYTLYEYYIEGNSLDTVLKYAQPFVVGAVGPNENFILKGVSINGYAEGNPPTELSVGIYTTNAQDEPVDKLVENTIRLTGNAWYDVVLPNYSLLAGEKYDLVFSVSEFNPTNRYWIYRNLDGCTYPGGTALVWDGSSWSKWGIWNLSRCFNFKIYGVPDTDLDGVPNDTDLCPDTSSGVGVDTDGCSASQFCNSFNPLGDKKDANREACVSADWLGNEAGAGKGKGKRTGPQDCYIERNLKSDIFDDSCEATSNAD